MTNDDLVASRAVADAARRAWRWIVGAFMVLLISALLATFALNTRSRIDEETSNRSKETRAGLLIGCRNVNALAKAVKGIIASQGTVLAPIDASSLGFTDPAVARYVQGIIDKSQANARTIHEKGKGIRLLDCVKLATAPPRHGEPVPTLPPPTTTTTGVSGR